MLWPKCPVTETAHAETARPKIPVQALYNARLQWDTWLTFNRSSSLYVAYFPFSTVTHFVETSCISGSHVSRLCGYKRCKDLRYLIIRGHGSVYRLVLLHRTCSWLRMWRRMVQSPFNLQRAAASTRLIRRSTDW